MNTTEPIRLNRREALQWVAAAAASLSIATPPILGADTAPVSSAKPYGTDPLLNKTYAPGDFWPLTLSDDQRRTVTVLADLIVPADETSPAASEVGVPAFIDEWISAPYPYQQKDRETILTGLSWLEAESRKRFGKGFAELTAGQHTQIADDICYLPKASAEMKVGAQFFSTFRNLTTAGFYSTPAGMKDIGYRGNVPLTKFEGPPQEVLQKLGLA